MDSFVKVLTSQVGKYMFALPFLAFGAFHLMNASDFATNMNVPGGEIMVYFTGISMIAAAVSIFIGKYTKLAMVLLGVMLLLFILIIHVPGMGSEDEMVAQMSMSSMLKDLALAGGAWILGDRYDKLF